jgi:hypothetical protein
MKEHQGSLIGTWLTWVFALLSKLFEHFESHGATYAQLAAVIVAGFTITNIIRGWRRERRNNQ